MSLGALEHDEHPAGAGTEAPGHEAIHAFRRAAHGDLADPDYLYILGCALARQGRHEDAASALREALATPGSHPSYRRALGESLFWLSCYEEAADSFSQVLREDAGDAEAANGLGVALLRLGRTKEAAQALRRALQSDGSRAGWLSNLGAALLAAGDPAEATRLLRNAVAANPVHPSPRRNLGRVLLIRGDNEDARECFREVLRLTGGDAVGHMDLGDALFATGRPDEAEAEYERGIALEPSVIASRGGSRAAWQAIRLNRARRDLGADHEERSLGPTLWASVLGGAHALKPTLDWFGRTPARRTSAVVALVLVLVVGRASLVLLPHYVAHHRLYDELVRLAREPNYDDDQVREQALRALHAYGRDRYVRPDDVRVKGLHQMRRVEFGYEVPMLLLPGLVTRIPFRMQVEEPCLREPPPVIL